MRNVAVSAPYLHDGSAADLATAVAAHGISLSGDGVRDLVAFLEGLTDRKFLTDPDHAVPVKACGKAL